MLQKYCQFAEEDAGMQACIDEAGRGSWAGRVYTAAVVWNPYLDDEMVRRIKDSKRLSPHVREMLYDYIIENAIDYSIKYKEPHEIDQVNILNATMESMNECINSLTVGIDSIIVDGDMFVPGKSVKQMPPYKCIIGGDNKYVGIAAASILAKVSHDRHMKEIALLHPEYGWEKNMGYGTPEHKEALQTHGITPYHRRSYKPCKN